MVSSGLSLFEGIIFRLVSVRDFSVFMSEVSFEVPLD